MLKKGKKFIVLSLVLALVVGVLGACSNSTAPTVDYTPTEAAAVSNGGFVVEKGDYFYFINGVAAAEDDNTFGDVVEGSLMRISKTDLGKGDYSTAEIVVPSLMVAADYTSGIYVYGDYVYYATPNTTKDMDGKVDTSYLEFKSAKLDGTAMKDYYLRLDSNSYVYRFVEVDGTVYLVYVDSNNTEIRSLNTSTREETVLVKGYTSYTMNVEDLSDPVIYYTMNVDKKDGSGTEGYQQIYKVRADATECPYDMDLSEYKTSKGEDYEYTNLGTIVLDGVGNNKTPSPFNHDWDENTSPKTLEGYTYAFVKYTGEKLILNVTRNSQTFVYALDCADVADGWNSITANPSGEDAGGLTPVAVSTSYATSSALYYTDDAGKLCYLYVDSANNVLNRVTVSEDKTSGDYIEGGSALTLARNLSGATLLYIEGDYVYFSMAGANGNSLYRIDYTGTEEDYNVFTGTAGDEEEGNAYIATRYLEIDYNSSWYPPEIVDGYLFFSNAEEYGENYIYVMANPADNNALKEINDRYDAVQDAFSDIAASFSEAANAARYYYYTGNTDLIYDETEPYFEKFDEEDFEVLEAFLEGGSAHNLDFSEVLDGDKACTQATFYNFVGERSEADEEAREEDLKTSLLPALDEEEETEAGWTWQWAALFVPIGVVVIAGIVVLVVLLKRRKRA